MIYSRKPLADSRLNRQKNHTLDWIEYGIRMIAPKQVNLRGILIQSSKNWTTRDDRDLANLIEHICGRAQSNHSTWQQALRLFPSNSLTCSLCRKRDPKCRTSRPKVESLEMDLFRSQ